MSSCQTLRVLTLSVVCLGSAVACDSHPVQVGMNENDVVKMMGKPTLAIDERQQVASLFANDPACVSKLTRVAVYDRWWRNDVVVGFDTSGIVQCVRTTIATAVTEFD